MCPGETVTCAYATGNSRALAWMTEGNTLTFFSNNSLLMRHDVSGSSTFAVLIENSDASGVRVIMSNLTVGVSTSSNDPEVTILFSSLEVEFLDKTANGQTN